MTFYADKKYPVCGWMYDHRQGIFLFELYAVCDILSKNVQRDDSINFYNIAKDGYALWRTLIISRWTGYYSR